jgi:hypothetical protein
MAKIEGFCAPGVYDPPNYTRVRKAIVPHVSQEEERD